MTQALYCSDEDILIRAPSDYLLLVPRANRIAYGTGGTVASDARWTLVADQDLASRGVEAGFVFTVSDEDDTARLSVRGTPFVASSVSGTSVVLRRAGWSDGVGEPPGAPGGSTGVSYEAMSLRPQIEQASYRLNQLYGIDERLTKRQSADLYDARAIRDLCVLIVLQRACHDAWTTEGDDIWRLKSASLSQEVSDMMASIQVKWGSTGSDGPPSGRNVARLSR